jgi:hypothetical protein
MKRFFLRLILFLVTSFALLNMVAAIYGRFSRSRYERDGSETFDAIRRAEAPATSPNILLGDSVCHQLTMGVDLPQTLNLSCSQAVSMCGQYLLARETIAHDPAARQITLAYLPACFDNDLMGPFTFNYLVKSFYIHPQMREGMDALVLQRLDRRPVYRLIAFPMFRYTDLLGATDYSGPPPTSFRFFSPVSVDYLRRLSDLCREHHIRLRIISPPVSTTGKYDAAGFQKEMSDAHLDSIFAGYTQTIRRVDPDELLDNIHFKPQYIPENSAEFVKLLEQARP